MVWDDCLEGSSRVDPEGFFKAFDGSLEVFDAEAVGDASLMTAAFGVDVEASGRSQHDGGTVVGEVCKEPLTEFVAVVDG